jgi:hypothetical protein
MRSANRVAVDAAVAVALLVACSQAALAGDFLQRKDGTFTPAIKGDIPEPADYEASTWQVRDANIDEIPYTMLVNGKAVAQTFKSADVMEIWPEPKKFPQPVWKDANSMDQIGDHVHASEKFRSIGMSKQVHPVVRQKAFLCAGRSLAAIGDAKSVAAADAVYEELLKEFPTSFYSRALGRERWQMWMDAGNEEKAKAAIDWLLKLPGVTDSDKLEARFALNTIALRKCVVAKDTAGIQKCLDEYKAIASETTGKKDLAIVNALARIGQGNCLLELSKATDARVIFEDISEHGTGNPVLAAAFNGLGECWFRQNDVKGYIEARRCFLRTVLLYSDGTPGDMVARALYYAGECFFRIQDNGDTWKDRARENLKSCYSRFPSSPWADRAKKLYLSIPPNTPK